MAQRNDALTKRARAHGVELHPDNEAQCRVAEDAAASVEREHALAVADVTRLKGEMKALAERLAAAEALAKGTIAWADPETGQPRTGTSSDKAKAFRGYAKDKRVAAVNLSVKAARIARLEALRDAMARELADVNAKLAAG